MAEQGLLQLPRYGPLWFCALRLQECTLTLTPTLTLTLALALVLALILTLTPTPTPSPHQECTSQKHDLMRATRTLVERGVRHISKDLVWKLWFESAQVEGLTRTLNPNPNPNPSPNPQP